MNKRLTAIFILIVVLTMMVATIMIGCGNEAEQLPSTTGSADNSGSQNTEATDISTGTVDTTAADGEVQTDKPLPPGVEVSMGVVDGAGSTDLEDDPERPTASQTTETTKPVQTTKPTQPWEQTPEEILGKDFDIDELDWATYHSMSPEKQKAVIALFSTPEDFAKWHKAALAQYKAEHPDVEIGEDGFVDLNP